MGGDGQDAPVMLMTGTVFGGEVDTALAAAPMKAQPRLGLARSWSWILGWRLSLPITWAA